MRERVEMGKSCEKEARRKEERRGSKKWRGFKRVEKVERDKIEGLS